MSAAMRTLANQMASVAGARLACGRLGSGANAYVWSTGATVAIVDTTSIPVFAIKRHTRRPKEASH